MDPESRQSDMSGERIRGPLLLKTKKNKNEVVASSQMERSGEPKNPFLNGERREGREKEKTVEQNQSQRAPKREEKKGE